MYFKTCRRWVLEECEAWQIGSVEQMYGGMRHSGILPDSLLGEASNQVKVSV